MTEKPRDLPDTSLTGGYPSQEALAALFEELDFQRAVQVYLWAVPAVAFRQTLDGLNAAYGPGTVAVFEDFLDAKTIVATGNGQSIYALTVPNLADTGPLVIEAPPKVLGFIMDTWQYPLEDIGALGPDKGQGGPFLILPPGYEGDVPDGFFVVRSDTNFVNVTVRGYVVEGRPEPAVEQIKRMRIYPLAQKDAPPEVVFVNASGVSANLFFHGDDLDTISYFELLAKVAHEDVSREKDRAMWGLAASIGIAKDRPFEPDERMTGILARAAKLGAAMAAAESCASRYPAKHTWEGTQWEEIFHTPHATLESPDYLEIDARVAIYYQAMGAAKAALLSVVGAGSKYSASFRDGSGAWLMGDAAYHLRVPADVPVADFWSVTVYDAVTRSMIDNAQGVSGRDSYDGLVTNHDGSVDLYFGPEAPPGHESNWVQTNPGVGFFVYFRWYGPTQPYFDKTWRLLDIQRLTT